MIPGRTEPLSFGVMLDVRPYGQYFGEGESSYTIDGEDVAYAFGNDIEELFAMGEEHVLLPIVTANVERLS